MSSDAPSPPTRTRFVAGAWLCSMAAILYLDRIAWGKASPSIQEDFALSYTQMSLLMMSFQVAYGLFEIPTGAWGERIGARRILTRICVWWSVFTALTGAAFGFWSMLFIRFLFGAGEAGAYPNAARVFTKWFPAVERGRMQGIMLATALIGGAASPALAAYLIEAAGWRWTFVVFGTVGLVWAAGFWWWFRDDPADHKQVNEAELALIRSGGGVPKLEHAAIPWRLVFANRGVLALGLIIMCSSFNSYFYFNWFPTYLEDAHGISNTQSGWLTSLALAGSATGVLLGGIAADRFLKTSANPLMARKRFCGTAFLGGAVFLMIAIQSDQVTTLAIFAALSTMSVQLTLPSWWSAAIEQSGRHVGPIFGMLNMIGTVGALATQGFAGVFADIQAWRGLSGRAQWDDMFVVYVAVLTVGALSWWFLYQRRPIGAEEESKGNEQPPEG